MTNTTTDIKSKVKRFYGEYADFWSKSRDAVPGNDTDPKLLKQNRPHYFIEKPAMFSELPESLEGFSILCLGCGSGEECNEILKRGADKVVGVDLSDKLIEKAKEKYPQIEFREMDAEDLKFGDSRFDLVYSSLVLNYLKNWDKVLSEVYRVLKPNGVFIFSDVHPVKWASEKVNDADGKSKSALMGFDRDQETGKTKILGDYLNVRSHSEIWMNKIEVTHYTRPLYLMFRAIVNAGFVVQDMYEPKATEEAKKYDLEYWKVNQKIPNFIIWKCTKNK